MQNRESSKIIMSLLIIVAVISGLAPSTSLASYTIFDKVDPRNYVISSQYFRFSPPKKIIDPIKAVDPRYPNCEYRKVTFYPEQYDHQFYGRLCANCSEVNIDGQSSSEVTGTVSGLGLTFPLTFRSGALRTSNASTLAQGGEFAIGYLWCSVRAEAEFLMNTKSDGTATATVDPRNTSLPAPLLAVLPNTITFPMNVSVQSQCYFANLYYDFFISERIRPFIMCGAGIASNTLSIDAGDGDDDIFDIESKSTRRLNFAYSAGLGVRIRVFSSLFATASYRYMRLGSVSTEIPSVSANFNDTFFANLPVTKMSTADLYQNTISVGIMYLF